MFYAKRFPKYFGFVHVYSNFGKSVHFGNHEKFRQNTSLHQIHRQTEYFFRELLSDEENVVLTKFPKTTFYQNKNHVGTASNP